MYSAQLQLSYETHLPTADQYRLSLGVLPNASRALGNAIWLLVKSTTIF